MKCSRTTIPLMLALLACFSVVPSVHAAAQEGRGRPQSLMAGERGQGQQRSEEQAPVSRREASDRARQVFPGRVLGIRLEGDQWRIRMDQEGTVFNVFVDAESGQVNRGAAE